MKNRGKLFGLTVAAAFTVLLGGCAASSGTRASYADDLYAPHNRKAIAERERIEAEAAMAEALAREAKARASLAGAQAKAAEALASAGEYNTLSQMVVNDYGGAYQRRLRGFDSPTYTMPASYYDLSYAGSDALTYDPQQYNLIVQGDQVWLEPKYVTSLFGTWSEPQKTTVRINIGFGSYYPYDYWWYRPYRRGGWYSWDRYHWDPWYGGHYYDPWGWGYNHYNYGWGWHSYNHYYPNRPGYWNGGGHHNNRPSYTSQRPITRPSIPVGIPGRGTSSSSVGGAGAPSGSYRDRNSSGVGSTSSGASGAIPGRGGSTTGTTGTTVRPGTSTGTSAGGSSTPFSSGRTGVATPSTSGSSSGSGGSSSAPSSGSSSSSSSYRSSGSSSAPSSGSSSSSSAPSSGSSSSSSSYRSSGSSSAPSSGGSSSSSYGGSSSSRSSGGR